MTPLQDEDSYECLPPRALFAHNLIKTGPDAFFSRIGRNMATNMAVLPGAAWTLKKAADGTPLGGMHLVSSIQTIPPARPWLLPFLTHPSLSMPLAETRSALQIHAAC